MPQLEFLSMSGAREMFLISFFQRGVSCMTILIYALYNLLLHLAS